MFKFVALFATDMIKDVLRHPEFPSFVAGSSKRAALAARNFNGKERCSECGGVGYVTRREAARPEPLRPVPEERAAA